VEGLIESELFDIANDTLQNFMDELDTIGFIPNGGRIYCMRVLPRMHFLISPFPLDLDRSQPPLFIQVYKSTFPNCSFIHTSEDVGALYHSKQRYQYSHSCFTFSRGKECRFCFPILSSEMTNRKSSNGGTTTDP
jgi:neutral trehalase